MRANQAFWLMTMLGATMILLGSGCAGQSTSGNDSDEMNNNADQSACVDGDSDGYGAGCSAGSDCDDTNGAVHAGAPELCNGVDDNCDGTVDEGVQNACGNCDSTCDLGAAEECTPDGEMAYDEDRDGQVDEDCGCQPGETQACCGLGIQVCIDQGGEFGSTWGQCEGGMLEAEICGDGIDQDCDGLDVDCPDVEVLCTTSPHVTESFSLEFPGASAACPWGQGDNENTISGVHAARLEHVLSLDLPPNAAICNLDFNVPQTSMYYDDSFMVAFNEAALIASFNVDQLLPNQGGLFIYDWSHMRAQPFSGNLYCLGGGPCELPDTQNQGVFSLDLSQSITYALAQRALNLHRYDFLVYTDGDNDPGVDCTYSPFTLEVEVEYVVP